MMLATLGICALLIGSSIACLLVWMLFLTPKRNNRKNVHFCGGLGFHSALKMYNMLRIMTLIEEELFRELVLPYLHHFLAVVLSTGAHISVLIEVSSRGGKSLSLILVAIAIWIVSMVTEFFSICVIAKIGVLSRTFFMRLRSEDGRDPYRKRLLDSMLPNSICLEFLRSVGTIHNGVEMKYFLNYLDRVMNCTVTILLAYVH